ncbi:MAG: ATP-binding protein, partial [Lachnospiraceae bacterium]|nr:ATP-binding protein [Lachnospiraceae bacterium]
MISENIYALTRVTNSSKLQRMEKQMSRRQYFLKVKGWEIRGLRSLTDKIHERIRDISYLDFFYSFTIPKLG